MSDRNDRLPLCLPETVKFQEGRRGIPKRLAFAGACAARFGLSTVNAPPAFMGNNPHSRLAPLRRNPLEALPAAVIDHPYEKAGHTGQVPLGE